MAFGLGIDLGGIRRVIHIGVPSTVEEYFQEAGRAVRDGLPATAHIYYNLHDISKARTHLSKEMRAYVKSPNCKREIILYFGFQMQPMEILHETDFPTSSFPLPNLGTFGVHLICTQSIPQMYLKRYI